MKRTKLHKRYGHATYNHVAWQDEGVWTVHSPSIPGVYGLGGTQRAAESDFRASLREMLAYLTEIGEAPPPSKHLAIGETSIRT